jgi:hypothetical protein
LRNKQRPRSSSFLETVKMRGCVVGVMGRVRGQGSTEYLVVLGAVLLVGLVAVGTMVTLPALGQSAREQQFNQYWARATPYSLTAFKLGANSFSLRLTNNEKKTVVLTGAEIGSDTQVIAFWNPSNSQSFRPGQQTTVTNESFGFSGNPCYGKNLGTYYELKNITLIYTAGGITDMRQVGLGIAGACSDTVTATATPETPSSVPESTAIPTPA